METCSICKEEIEKKHFGRHINSEHKITLARYHETYCPRFDLLTNEKISFENSPQYYTTFYLNKENMGKHLLSLPIEKSAEICKDIFSSYKEYKKGIWAPSQVETRTTNLPSPTLFDRLGLDYNVICLLNIRISIVYFIQVKLKRNVINRRITKVPFV